ncbi:MAG: helix-turn-helix transcriptional regulator [Thermomicrobiales bacterium]
MTEATTARRATRDIDTDPDRLISIKHVSDLTDIPRATAYELAASGVWETVQTGPRQIRVNLASVRAWIKANTRSATQSR